MSRSLLTLVSASVVLAVASMVPAHAAVDADAAQALFKKNKCGTCHAPDKTKSGPSLKCIAAEHKGKADGQDKVVKQISAAPKLKAGGEHPAIDTKDAKELKNLADWILAQ